VGQVTCTEMFIKVLHELGAVVGQDVLEREGEEEGGEVEEVLGRLARMAPRGPSQGEAGGQIGERNDVSPVPLDEALDGIQGDAMARVSGHKLLGFSALFGSFSHHGLSVTVQPHWAQSKPSHIFDQIADGRGLRAGEPLLHAPGLEQIEDFFFPQVGVVLPQAFDLSEEERGPPPAAQGPGGALRPWVQCLHISMGLFEDGFPEEKGAAFCAEGRQGGFQLVLLPEGENLDTSFRFVCLCMLPSSGILCQTSRPFYTIK